MANVVPFPFDKLPQYTREDVLLKKKLFATYQVIESRSKFFRSVMTPLVTIFGSELSLKITHLESASYDQLVLGFADNQLMGVVRTEPLGKKAGLVFDGLLAKLLIHKILSKAPLTTDRITQFQLKPLTVLEEAVVQYVLVSLIEKITSSLDMKNFTLAYENVLTTQDEIKGTFSAQEQFAILSIKLKYAARDFYLKLILPVSLVDDLESETRQQAMLLQRIKQFENFTTEFQLEIARVTLEPEDVNVLSVGDIILFDEAFAQKTGSKITGQAEMKQVDSGSTEGYLVLLETEKDSVKARIDSML